MNNYIVSQIPFLLAIVLLVVRVVIATKRGFVKELCALISTFFAAIAVMLIAFAMRKYFDEARIIFIITLILLFLLFVIYKIISTLLIGLKIMAKLPGLNIVDRIAGVVIAIVETVLVIWTVYCLVMVLNLGAIATNVFDCVRNNAIMRFLYSYNYLYLLIAKFSSTLQAVDVWGMLGM